MHTQHSFLKKIKKNKKLVILATFIVVIVFGFIIFGRGGDVSVETAQALRGDLKEEVNVSGKLKALSDVSLGFSRGGKVSEVRKDIGDRVSPGDIIAVLDSRELFADLSQAKAKVIAEEARLSELKKGTRAETVRIAEIKLNKAKQDLATLYVDIPTVLSSAFIDANDALTVKTDDLFTGEGTQTPQLSFITADSQAEIDAEFQRLLVDQALASFKQLNNTLAGAQNGTESHLKKGEEYLVIIEAFLKRTQDALDDATSVSGTTLATYKGYLTTALTNVNSALSDVRGKLQSIEAQKLSINTAEEEYGLALAGSTEEAIQVQEAAVLQVKAQVEKIEIQIEENRLRSPIRGVVTKQDATVGEIVSANETLATVISEGLFEIESYVPEADIVSVSEGDTAFFTLDAFGDRRMFEAAVSKIEPGETVREGVSTYKVILTFQDTEGVVKPGMTADIDIVTEEAKGVLYVPARAIIEEEGESLVRVLLGDGTVTRVRVETGIKDIYGNVEIRAGLSEGETVITFSSEEES